ncbi:uncharacterized protein LOC115229855 [Octopus sinensis]|uniref:Uncharacterized protein LOC115229855 n=1 Tax=Octopus sinensis TaxID=2607531 RepID=A0A6P7TUK4_9MOLL|nr:uncharacterized protein LOC115229855 [Octopus sinensis]
MANGDLPEFSRELLFSARLLACKKPNEGIRPVGVGNYFRSLTAKFDTIESSEGEKEGEKIVLVSAYYVIDSFTKVGGKIRTKENYYTWLDRFRFINNDLIFFSDSYEPLRHVRKIRKSKPTLLLFLNRSELIGFKNIDKINHIFTLPGYRRDLTETANCHYSAIMHSKHDLIERAIKLGGNLSYYAWVDAGLFRYTPFSEDVILRANKYIDKTRLVMSQIYDFRDYSIEEITKGPHIWVSGGFLVGYVNVLLKFCEVYRNFFFKLLSMNLIATDEQAIYSLYSSQGRALMNDSVKLQVFQCQYFGLYSLFGRVVAVESCP